MLIFGKMIMDPGMEELGVESLWLVFEPQILLCVFAFKGDYAVLL